MVCKKQVITDMILNIMSAAIPVAVLQLFVYPITAQIVGSDEYGLMLAIYSIWIMISNSLGNVLNNIRLLHNNNYEEMDEKGDLNVLLIRWSIANALAVGIIIAFYCGSLNFYHIALGVLTAALIIMKAYLEVGFRLILNYRAILLNNVLQSIGFLAGAYITAVTNMWESIFIAGYLLSCLYCAIKTKLLNEPYRKTKLFKCVNRDANKLAFATIISNMMTYADKLVLYPLMGGHAVSVYYTAAILGKMVGMLTGPINSVILSYISRWKENQKGLVKKILLIGTGLCVIGYVITIVISRPIIGILFPQWIDEVMLYIPVTTFNVMLLVLISILSPFILKFCDMKWQIIINGVGVIIYFISAVLLWIHFGLMGFCFGVIAGNLVKLFIMMYVFIKGRTEKNTNIER